MSNNQISIQSAPLKKFAWCLWPAFFPICFQTHIWKIQIHIVFLLSMRTRIPGQESSSKIWLLVILLTQIEWVLFHGWCDVYICLLKKIAWALYQTSCWRSVPANIWLINAHPVGCCCNHNLHFIGEKLLMRLLPQTMAHVCVIGCHLCLHENVSIIRKRHSLIPCIGMTLRLSWQVVIGLI